ncbi:MAG TPA: DNA starvation/stationary phase protection protein [Ferruginibacter sp.]|nr:DNA starvation/stationary phase protection protein [Ferruginibacter sp.]
MNTNIGISDANSKAVALELNKLLANEVVLYTKTRNYHWNIESPSFMEVHKLLEGQYGELEEMIDSVAERIRSIGHYAEGRLVDFLKLTSLLEPDNTTNQKVQLKNLLDDHETIIRELRALITKFADEYKDLGSSDFVTGLIGKHEKTAWILRSYNK